MIAAFFISFKIRFQKIGKEEQFQDQEKNYEFNNDDRPQPFTHGHAFKTLVVKLVYVSNELHVIKCLKCAKVPKVY